MNDTKDPAKSSDAGDPEAAPADDRQGNAGEPAAEKKRPRLDPTRYGDWEKDGRCIDF